MTGAVSGLSKAGTPEASTSGELFPPNPRQEFKTSGQPSPLTLPPVTGAELNHSMPLAGPDDDSSMFKHPVVPNRRVIVPSHPLAAPPLAWPTTSSATGQIQAQVLYTRSLHVGTSLNEYSLRSNSVPAVKSIGSTSASTSNLQGFPRPSTSMRESLAQESLESFARRHERQAEPEPASSPPAAPPKIALLVLSTSSAVDAEPATPAPAPLPCATSSDAAAPSDPLRHTVLATQPPLPSSPPTPRLPSLPPQSRPNRVVPRWPDGSIPCIPSSYVQRYRLRIPLAHLSKRDVRKRRASGLSEVDGCEKEGKRVKRVAGNEVDSMVDDRKQQDSGDASGVD
ncbi:hypothetical protein ACM66B_005259 [Microbotryomycetes sp. NB124-2]